MAELKTKETKASVEKFIKSLKDEEKEKDCEKIIKMMKKATKSEPKMWGSAIIGFGNTRIKYASGRELDWLKIGFSPRKAALTLYLMCGLCKKELMSKLGKYKTGKGCLYIKKLSDVDEKVLNEIIKFTLMNSKKQFGGS